MIRWKRFCSHKERLELMLLRDEFDSTLAVANENIVLLTTAVEGSTQSINTKSEENTSRTEKERTTTSLPTLSAGSGQLPKQRWIWCRRGRLSLSLASATG